MSQQTSIERVLIVGGGLAGLALAIALRQRGVSATIVERSSHWATGGAGLYLVGAATRAMRSLGVADAAAREGCVIRRQVFYNHRGTRIAEIDVESFWQGCGPCLGVARSGLHELLVQQAGRQHIRLGVTVQALRQLEDQVRVRFSDGAVESYDLVVGADGIRSSIRRLEFGDVEPKFRGQVGWRFITRRPEGLDDWTVFLGPGLAFLMLPIGADLAYCYADQSIAVAAPAAMHGSTETLREAFADFAQPVREVLARLGPADTIHCSAIEEVAQQAYGQGFGRGRVVLIGDAAHAMSPNMACGAAMAFEDALVLAEIVSRGLAASDVVAQFVRRRSLRVGRVRQQTDRRDRLRSLPPVARDLLLRLMFKRLYAGNYRPLLAVP